jgi:putative aldouronate transport system substrate-binding protein
MNKNIKKVSSAIAMSVLLSSALSGCKKAEPVMSPSLDNTPAAVITYPLKSDVTLSYWCYFYGDAAYGTNLGDLPVGKELEKKTGVRVKWIHPARGSESEQFNLMLAGGELPDIIQTNWFRFAGGPEKAISDNIIIPLNDIINKNAPNLKTLLTANKDIDKMVKTDAGNYYVFPLLRTLEADLPPVYTGPMVRKDWLDDLGLKVPTTIEEWEVMLKAFKEKKNVESPFTAYSFSAGGLMKSSAMFASAYGVMDDFYIKDGKTVYGPTQSGFKEYLTLMNKWYKAGLIDKDIFTIDQKTADAKILSGKTGSLVGNLGGNMGKYLDAMRAKDPKYDLIGAPYPTLKKGDKPIFGQLAYIYGDSNGSSAITAASKNKELAAKYLDYAYSKEGQMLYNFGIEGTSYNMINGVPTYSDQMTKDPKLTFAQAVTGYTSTNSSVVLHAEFFKQFSLPLPQQKDAMEKWKNTDMKKYQMPPVTATKEESSEIASVMNDVESYKQEMVAKFILGTEPLEGFDKFVAQINKLGLERVLKLKDAAIERYNKR